MRITALLLVASLLLAPFAIGQDDAPLLEDDEGDQAVVAGPAAQPGAPTGESVDLLSLHAAEHPDKLLFTLRVADLGADGGEALRREHSVVFRHVDRTYRAYVESGGVGGTFVFAWLEVQDPGTNRFSFVEELVAEMDSAESLIRIEVPRTLILDSQGAPPMPDRELDAFYATAHLNRFFSSFSVQNGTDVEAVQIMDRMPDSGAGDAPLEIEMGVEQTGDARLASDEPFRASNGAATTFLYTVQASNIGDEQDTFRLTAEGMPGTWTLQMPQTVQLGAGQTLDVPIVVRTTSTHAHGARETFLLEMTGQRDPGSVGRLEMGIYYPAIPQPAGHHSSLWIHSIDHADEAATMLVGTAIEAAGFDGGLQDAYMNTLEEDDRADEVPVRGQYAGFPQGDGYAVGSTYRWTIPLDPGLLMGLDFDVQSPGSLEATIASTAPMPQTSIIGELRYMRDNDDRFNFGSNCWWDPDPDEGAILADIEQTDLQDIDLNGQATFTATVQPRPEADLIPYEAGSSLFLCLWADTLRPDNFYLGPKAEPDLLPGARLDLPLKEYADPVADLFAAPRVSLEINGSQQQMVNPGKTRLFELSLENESNRTHAFRLTLVGSNREWARVAGPDMLHLKAGDQATFGVAVTAPPGAADGESADLILEAASLEDLGTRAIARLFVEVDTDEEHPDDAERADAIGAPKGKDSPAPWIWAPLLLWAARRRP